MSKPVALFAVATTLLASVAALAQTEATAADPEAARARAAEVAAAQAAEVVAQQTSDEVVREQEKRARAYNTLAAPPNLQLGTLPATNAGSVKEVSAAFVLEGTKDEKTGTASVGWKNNKEQFRLSAKGPLDRKSQQASPLSLDGLSAGSTVEAGFNRFQWTPSSPEENEEIFDMCREIRAAACQADPACRSSVQNVQDPCATPRVPEDCAYLCCEDLKDKATQQRCRPTKPAICSQRLCDLRNVPPRYRARLRRLLHLDDPIRFWGGSASVGRSTFDYLEGTALEAKSVVRNAWSASGRIGQFTSMGFLIGSYTYQRDFKPGSAEKQICQPLAGTNATTCQAAVLGAPTEQTRSIAAVELRRFLANGVVLAPIVQRDLKQKVTLVALPVYFLKDSTGGATGGLRLAWRSDTDSATLSLFVGAAIGLGP